MPETKTWFKSEVTLGQVLAIAVPIVIMLISNWVSLKYDFISKDSDYKILQAKVETLEKNYQEQNSYIIKTFGEFQKTLFDIQLSVKDKEDRKAVNK